jgi:hypothetical protein
MFLVMGGGISVDIQRTYHESLTCDLDDNTDAEYVCYNFINILPGSELSC